MTPPPKKKKKKKKKNDINNFNFCQTIVAELNWLRRDTSGCFDILFWGHGTGRDFLRGQKCSRTTELHNPLSFTISHTHVHKNCKFISVTMTCKILGNIVNFHLYQSLSIYINMDGFINGKNIFEIYLNNFQKFWLVQSQLGGRQRANHRLVQELLPPIRSLQAVWSLKDGVVQTLVDLKMER